MIVHFHVSLELAFLCRGCCVAATLSTVNIFHFLWFTSAVTRPISFRFGALASSRCGIQPQDYSVLDITLQCHSVATCFTFL